jgi:riboflavin synthase
MFTGIVEVVAEIQDIIIEGTNKNFILKSDLASQLKVDQSISHDGVCLTVTHIDKDVYSVTAVDETLKKTTLNSWQTGRMVNIERCMSANGRFDGHIVQGHVDQTAICTSVQNLDGSWLYDFSYDPGLGNITVEKGSICINGVSLTVFNSEPSSFRVTIIPYTHEFTNFNQLKTGDSVNLEFDIVGKYIKRIIDARIA